MVTTGPAIVAVAVRDDAAVTMAGFCGTYCAQMPWKYVCAEEISLSEAPWAERHAKTRVVRLELGQKQL
jgi:hypothetical protein